MDDPADLHLHSFHSDGVHSPAAIVRRAERAGLRALALTDHDTVSGLPEAEAEARRCGLTLIPAVEIGVAEGGVDVHLLAYHVDPENAGLLRLLEALRLGRERRLARILRRLRLLGMPLTVSEVRRHAPAQGPVGRPHVGAALVARGWVRSLEDAFRHWIGSGGPAYLPNETPPAEAVLAAILRAGGIPVLAHPALYRFESFLERYRRAGLLGLEVRHPRHDPGMVARLRRRAAEAGLLETGGSDYHGLLRSESPVGSHRPPEGCLARLARTRRRVPSIVRRLHGVRR